MPDFKFTIDDINPMIIYEPSSAWRPGNKSADPEASNYSNNGTFTLCQQRGATATFKFNGTGVGIYGAKRSNHGTYTANLDGSINRFDGYSQNSIFNQPLFEASSLQNGPHTLVLTNTQTNSNFSYLDIDYVTWNVSLEDDILPPTITYQDYDPRFSYEPSDAWTAQTSVNGYQNQSGHRTTQANATVTLTFNGEEVRIFGLVGPNASPYVVTVDNSTVGTFNGTTRDMSSGVMLYETSNLGPGQHTLTLMNTPNGTAQTLFIAYAVVTDNTTDVSSDSSSLSSGAIAGIAVGAVVGLAALALIVFFWRRGKKDNHSRRMSLDMASPLDIRTALVDPFVSHSSTDTGFNPAGPPTSDTSASVPRMRSDSTSLTNAWPSHPSSSTDGPGRRNPSMTPLMLASSSDEDSPFPTSSYSTPLTAQSQARSRKGQPTVLPASENQSMQHLPAEELRSTRMVVEGREQDFGPVPTPDVDDVLPPNYDQAIEPLHQRS
ncbi:uncharacterized protein EV420DRAFT_435073 [Desarmillaria tabescens]|uniref:Transmembrane protein n=1 Tax=Armillaria tabescens TaxID=1929756 RepID=A0AA39U6G3_ARMTA|nr:uncharacterized protein EV420DRAFT_435073 [Desarmillaria tabescens]KAK0467925.1 hypothetical protein EV420DRAFT_435073 [Desarmillaria tabescens]